MKKLIIILLSCTLLQGCYSSFQLRPQALEGQMESYHQGIGVLVSPIENLVPIKPASHSYSPNDQELPTLVVSVFNKTQQQFNFSTEDIKVFVDGMPHKVFTYEELVAKAKIKAFWRRLSAAAGAMGNYMKANEAGYIYHSGRSTSSISLRGPGGFVTGSGSASYFGHTYDPAAALYAQMAVKEHVRAEKERIKDETDRVLSSLGATILRKTTVFPGYIAGGQVVMDNIAKPAEPHEVKVVVSAGGERHEFLLQHLKVQR